MPYNIQGSAVRLDAEPFLHANKHYVPLRDLVNALGGRVNFDNDQKVATATIGDWTARVQMANENIAVSGPSTTTVSLTAPPFVQDGQMYVPFDFFRDVFGYQVSFANDTMNISNPNAA